MTRPALPLCLTLSLGSMAGAQSLPAAETRLVPRQVSAPAADILDGTLRMPAPSAGAVRCRGALFPLQWEADRAGGWVALHSLPVSAGPLGLAVRAPGASGFEIDLSVGEAAGLLTLDETLRSAAQSTARRRDQVLPADLGGNEVQRWDLTLSQSGAAFVRVRARGPHAPGPGHLAVQDNQPLTAAAYLDSYERLSNRRLGLTAQVEFDGDGLTENRLVHAISSAWAQVEGPGFSARLPLADDGLSADGAAGDGRFGVRLPTGLSGSYAARVELQGTWNGAAFQRTTRVTFEVAEPSVALTGEARTKVVDAGRLRLDIDALSFSNVDSDDDRVLLAAEVWAHDPWGVPRPMAWLSRIGSPRLEGAEAGHTSLSLWLDAGWFTATGLRPPLELRHVRVQDPNHLGVLASAERLPIPVGPLPPMAGRPSPEPFALWGVGINAAGPAGPAVNIQPELPRPGLMLCHGYCSGGNVWPNSDFAQPKRGFSDPNQNRTHDEFANRILNQASGYASFGVVGHSQGGAAALHLLTYYQSPLDRAQGPRRIQSVGTPYQGTPLASLGFFACGVNNNMTPGGAATWLAGIPNWARAEVFYYTTANDGFACQFLVDLLLSNPEDGTTERSRGQLPGANNMGHVTGWCHTTGMSDPPQYRDGSRNDVMDAQAAR